MSEQSEHPGPPGQRPGTGTAADSAARGGPEPEALRFFGTTWVAHDGGYGFRRVAAAVGSLAAAVAACFVLRFAYQGLQIADVGGFAGVLVVVMFAVCSAVAFRKTWEGFARRPADPERDASLRSLRMIGFVGALLAYFARSLTEAPGEGLRRTEYATARAEYDRRRASRAGNPASRRATGPRGSGKRR